MNKNIIWIVLVIVVGAGAFFGGMKYQQSKRTTQFRGVNGVPGTVQGGAQGQRQGGQGAGNRMGFQPVNGDIINSDAQSITVKLADGSSKIVILSDKTVINKASTATKADLTTGQKVAVFGATNTDGSVTAQSIQLNPIVREIPTLTPTPTK